MSKLDKFWDFVKEALTSGSNTSSKRLNGTIGFILVQLIILFAVVYDFSRNSKLSPIVATLVEVDLYTSAALLGIGGITEGIKNKLSK